MHQLPVHFSLSLILYNLLSGRKKTMLTCLIVFIGPIERSNVRTVIISVRDPKRFIHLHVMSEEGIVRNESLRGIPKR